MPSEKSTLKAYLYFVICYSVVLLFPSHFLQRQNHSLNYPKQEEPIF